MSRTAIQLYTLNGFDVTESTKVRIAAETSVDGVEMVYNGHPTKQTLNALEETNLEVAGLTVGAADIPEATASINTACEALNCDTVILGYLDSSHFESAKATRETTAFLDATAESFAERGLRFLYHTHRHEFAGLGNRTHFDLLVDETAGAVELELDLGWAILAGVDPYSLMVDIQDRLASVHLKDVSVEDESFANLGNGDLDVERAGRVAIEAGVDWIVYEHEDPTDPVESVVNGASKLQQLKQFAGSP
ncbi:sugar phosphate isomerase/epimerase family protein [Halocatena marina]|uniref:Sugar phosphate isomerase/epimerase family protein n=1 Tax=Halocatena marina TaxID=2934937 RepID=A0ABD5YKH7_9EURY